MALNLLKQIETKQSTKFIWANLLNHRKWSSKSIKLTKGQPQTVEGGLGCKSINIHRHTHMCVYINLSGRGILEQRGGQHSFGAFRSIVIVAVASIWWTVWTLRSRPVTCGTYLLGHGLWVVGYATALRSELRSHIRYGGWLLSKWETGNGGKIVWHI